MFSVVYQVRSTGNYEVAGFAQSLAGANRLAKVFLKDRSLTSEVRVYRGAPGSMLLSTEQN